MAAAATVVCRLLVQPAVVVIEDEMLAFVAHDVGDAAEISLVFGDDKGARLISQDHPGSINVAALVVNAPGILQGRDGDVRRICALVISGPIRARDENCVGGIICPRTITPAARDGEEFRKAVVNGSHHIRIRHRPGKDLDALRCPYRIIETVAGNLLRARDETRVGAALRAGRAARIEKADSAQSNKQKKEQSNFIAMSFHLDDLSLANQR